MANKLKGMTGKLIVGGASFAVASSVADGLYEKDPDNIAGNLGKGLALSGSSWLFSKMIFGKKSKMPAVVLAGTSLAYMVSWMVQSKHKEMMSPEIAGLGCQLHGPSCVGWHQSAIEGLGDLPAYLEPAFSEYTSKVPPSRWDVPKGLIEPGII